MSGPDSYVDETILRQLLDDVRAGRCTPDDAVARLRKLPFEDLGFARVDHHRTLRTGLPETIYGPGKSPEQCVDIVRRMLATSGVPVILSRADEAQVVAVTTSYASACVHPAPAGLATVVWRPAPARPERVVVVTAGTSDLPVADECAAVLGAHGVSPIRFNDVGVAGMHRLTDAAEDLFDADAVVVVAGMEGALASVVGGITGAPVVAVPTSVGYGAALEGVTALLAMLSSCANGLAVVGIDNGYGAAAAVLRIIGRAAAAKPTASGGDVASTATRSSPIPDQVGRS
jgi:NCAIR mutase (PurE)-related protein